MQVGNKVMFEGHICLIAYKGDTIFLEVPFEIKRAWPRNYNTSKLKDWVSQLTDTYWSVMESDLTLYEPTVNNSYSII